MSASPGIAGLVSLIPATSSRNVIKPVNAGDVSLETRSNADASIFKVKDAQIGFFGATPVGKAGATHDLKQSLVDLGLITGGGATDLDLNGGVLTGGVSISSLALTDGTNISVGTGTGTKIATATGQKIAFYNATPIAQQANTTDLRAAIINLGLIASGGATPLDLNSGALTAGNATLTPTTNPTTSLSVGGTISTATALAATALLSQSFTGAGDNPRGLAVSPTFGPNGTYANARTVHALPNFNPTTGNTISVGAGFVVGATTGSGGGTLTTMTGLALTVPTYGSVLPATAYGVRIQAQGNAGIGTVYGARIEDQAGGTTQIGLDVMAQTTGTTTVGARIAKPTGATSFALQMSDTGGTAAGGITFGTDTNLYRSAAATLKTDNSLLVGTNLTVTGTTALNDTVTMADAKNIVLNTTTGTKIGTATNQKLGFFNATPIIQPTGTTDLRAALINLGLYTSGGASPLDLNGGALTAGTLTASSYPALTVDLGAGTNSGVKVSGSGALGSPFIYYGSSGDANPKFSIFGTTPKLVWGAGGATAVDTNLYRDSADSLTTDDSFTVGANLSVTGTTLLSDNVTIANAKNIILNTSTGTKIGTGTTQKLGFWNATPVARPSAYTVTNPTTDRSLNVTADTATQIAQVLGTLIADLQSVGLIG